MLLVLSAPVIASNISRTVMNFVDFLMVSKLGTEAQAAILPAQIVLFCVVAIGIGTVGAVNTFVSQSLGRGEWSECAAYGWQGLYLSVAAGLLFAPGWFAVGPIFSWISHDAEVQTFERAYARIGVLGIGPSIAAVALSNFFTGIHKPSVSLVAAVVSNIFNVFANFALIFGCWGFPELGMEGAAWATLLSTILQVAMLLVWMLSPHYARVYRSWRSRRPSVWRIKGLLRVGLPSGIQFFADVCGWTVFCVLLVGQFGAVQLAAGNICFKLLELSFMPAVGMGQALIAAVGKSIGQGRNDMARSYARWAAAFNMGYMGSAGLIIALLRVPLTELLTDDVDVVQWASKMLIFCAIFQVFDGAGITYSCALRGAGDTLWQSIVMIGCAAAIFIGGGYLAVLFLPDWEGLGPWLAAMAYIVVLSVSLWARFSYGPWERVRLIRSSDTSETPFPS
jgi:MATE family multidrug resistance protein